MAVDEKHTYEATNGAQDRRRVCALPPQPTPALPPDLHPGRASAIRLGRTKWANGTVLHYWFFDGPDPQKDAVRNACPGFGNATLEPRDRSNLATAKTYPVRYDITKASAQDRAAIFRCVSTQPGIKGISQTDNGT